MMEIRWRTSLFCGALLAFVAAAQELAFISPDIAALSTDYRGWHYVMEGKDVTISWTTPFANTTLLVFEAQDDGTWTFDILGGKAVLIHRSIVAIADCDVQSGLPVVEHVVHLDS